MPTKGWLYRLNKTELTALMTTLQLDTNGTIDELRARLSQYITEHPEVPFGDPAVAGRAIEPRIEPPDVGKIVDRIRKWGCHFDGKDPFAFVERLSELRAAYAVSPAHLLLGLPELLRGNALLWYRNHRDEWGDWAAFEQAFREEFFPRRYARQARREIESRLQGSDEPYNTYANALLTLMRRAGGYSAEEQLEQLYENLLPDYQAYIRISDVADLRDLRDRAADFEAIAKRRKERGGTRKPAPSNPVAAVYDRTACCWRCKQRGHTRHDCQRPAKRFCSQCGKDGVLTRDCHPLPGNANRDGAPADKPRTE